MGSRPSSFRKGGGFLNNVDAVWSDYEFTTEFPGSDGNKKGSSDWNPLYAVLTFDVDGNDDPQSTTLLVGSADDFEIENDGKSLVPVENAGLRGTMPFGFFIGSLIEPVDGGNGFPEENLPDDDEPISYEAALGSRLRLVQTKDEESMKRKAKTWKQSRGAFNAEGQKKGKDGKYYNLTLLTVAEVYELPGEAPAKSAPASKAKAAAAPAKATKAPKVDPLQEEAVKVLNEVLSDAGGSIAKSKVPNKLVTKLGSKHPKREELRRLIFSDEFLSQEGLGWTYDQASKQQLITATEDE